MVQFRLRLHVEVSLGKMLNTEVLPMVVQSSCCCIAPDEQVDTLHGSLCHQCVNVLVNRWRVL